MATVALKEKSISLLSSTSSVDMSDAAAGTKTDLYTVPTGKVCIVTHIVVRSPSATLAGGTDYDFGAGTTPTAWNDTAIDLSNMTATTDAQLENAGNVFTVCAAGTTFGVIANTGSTGAATATIDVFGYLYDA